MAKEKQKKEQTTKDILQDLLIIQLALAGLTQRQIREIVGIDMRRVTRIVKHLNNTKKATNAESE